jgi:predicted transglutaminase-like cysteine proteinase
MSVLRRCCFVFALVFALRAQDADAQNRTDTKVISNEPIVESLPALAPFQHVRFCLRYPLDCQPSSTKRELIQPQTMELLISVNRKVNQLINPRPKAYDIGTYESWVIAPDMGDCNDYAVTKRHELLKRGLPSSALLLSVAKTPEGAGHLVLVVTTTVGNMVMDNLTDEIIPWQFTDYRWIKIQSTYDPHFWIGIRQPFAGEYDDHLPKNGPG